MLYAEPLAVGREMEKAAGETSAARKSQGSPFISGQRGNETHIPEGGGLDHEGKWK